MSYIATVQWHFIPDHKRGINKYWVSNEDFVWLVNSWNVDHRWKYLLTDMRYTTYNRFNDDKVITTQINWGVCRSKSLSYATLKEYYRCQECKYTFEKTPSMIVTCPACKHSTSDIFLIKLWGTSINNAIGFD